MAESRILGPDGQPVQREVLTEEIARASTTGVRNIWSFGSVAAGLSPDRLATLLRSAADGEHNDYLTLAEEMEERDLHYGSVLGTRKRAVSGLRPAVEAASDAAADIKLAEAVEDLVWRPEFAEMVDDTLDALGKGFSAIEMVWDRARLWTPAEYIWRDPRFFMFDRVNGRELRLVDESNSYEGVALPAYKFITHIPKLKSGLPIRSGLARLVSVAYMCKAFTLTDWMAFAEVFGMPLRVGRYGPNATESDIQTLVNAVANVGSDAAAVLPEGMRIEFEKNGTNSGGEELFEKLATYLDKQVSKAVLGQTMTADDGSSQSQAQVHDEVRGDILLSDVRQLENTLNRQLVRPFIDLNFGPQERYPRITFPISEPEDLKLLADSLNILVPLGLRVEESQIRDKFGIAEPAEGAILLQAGAASTQSAQPVAQNRTYQMALNQEQDKSLVDEIAEEPLDEWEEQVAPVTDPVNKLLSEVGSYEEFLEKLPGVIDQMDAGPLIRRLAEAAFKARGLGDATDSIED